MRKISLTLWVLLQLLFTSVVYAADVSKEQIKGLDEQVQDIKKDVIDLTAELLQLEEKLLYPSNSQFALFVSLADVENIRLDAIQIKLEDKIIAHHLYTFRELEAMQKGGVQKIYTGNVKSGQHVLSVSYSGKLINGGEIKKTSQHTLNKDVGPKFLEIKIGSAQGDAAGLEFKAW